jgi:hypothetical protein
VVAASLACTAFGAQPSFPTRAQIDDAVAHARIASHPARP